jgi:ATP-dependent RNA helicase SUPV3L1/SUV3
MESVAAQNEGADVEAPAAKVPAPARKIVAVRGDDRPGMKKAEPAPAGRPGRHGDSRPGAGMQDRPRRDNAPGRAPYAPAPDRDRGPRLGDAAFRARRDAMEHAQLALKKLSAQAHGQSLTQLLDGWKARDAALVPPAGELGGRVNASARQSWIQAVSASAKGTVADEALLRLEMAAEVPSPAGHVDARRALQLKMLTRRNDPAPAQTWQQDAAQVFSAEWDAESARRLQHTLKVLMKKV